MTRRVVDRTFGRVVKATDLSSVMETCMGSNPIGCIYTYNKKLFSRNTFLFHPPPLFFILK